MFVELLKSKIHRARLTFCDLNYEGSLAIDRDLMDEVGMLAGERILVVNNNNGERLVTYAIPAARGSKTFGLNGSAARKGQVGDVITIMSFAGVANDEISSWRPAVIVLDENNEVLQKRDKDYCVND